MSMPAFADPDCRICTLLLLEDELVAAVVVVVAVPVVEAVVAVADAAEVALLAAVVVALAVAAATALFMIGTRMIFLLGDVAADVVMMVVMLPLEGKSFHFKSMFLLRVSPINLSLINRFLHLSKSYHDLSTELLLLRIVDTQSCSSSHYLSMKCYTGLPAND